MAPGAPSVLTIRLSVTKVLYHKPANKLQILTDLFPERQPAASGNCFNPLLGSTERDAPEKF
jgi:hypothetical protein